MRDAFDNHFYAKKVWGLRRSLGIVNKTPATARRQQCRRGSRADRFDAVYLRAAQAYMLISMPTGTSTIFGVFQVIRVSQVVRRDVTPKLNLGPARTQRKWGRSAAEHEDDKPDSDISLVVKVISLLDKVLREFDRGC
jgi:hypothetical protein